MTAGPPPLPAFSDVPPRLFPMSTADILDGAFRLLRDNFRAIAIIVGCVIVPARILVAFLERNTFGGLALSSYLRDPSTTSSGNGLQTGRLLLSVGTDVLLLPFAAAAIALVVSGSYLGHPVGPGAALRATGRRAHSLLAAWLAWHPIELIGFGSCVLPGFAVMTLFVMVAPALMIEQLSFGKALSRSSQLAGRRFWFTLGVVALSSLIAQILGLVLAGVPDLVAFVIGLHWGWLVLALGAALSSFIVTPVAAVTATLLYVDARVRTEGLDLELMAAGLARSGG